MSVCELQVCGFRPYMATALHYESLLTSSFTGLKTSVPVMLHKTEPVRSYISVGLLLLR